MNREIIPKVKKIIGNSMVIAKELDAVDVKPEHLTLSLLRDNNNQCVDVLIAMGVDINTFYDLIYDVTVKSDLTPRVTQTKKIKRPFNSLTKTVFNTVDDECDKLGDAMIDTRHLMLAIIANNTLTTKVLFNLGVNYKSFKHTITNMRNKNEGSSDEDYGFDYETNKPANKKPAAKKGVSATPVLDNFCRDISKAVEEGKIDQVIGRSQEIKRVSQILSRRKKNNPVLIGEPGVGKTSIVEGLAQLIKDGKAPITLLNKRIYSLDLASIISRI